MDRRKFLKASSATVLGAVGATATAGTAAAHSVGSAIYTTDNLNVRNGVGLENDVIYTAEQYTGMYIEDGPWDEDGYTWWRVRTNGDSDNGRFEGYCVQQYTAHADFSFPATGYISSTYYDTRDDGYHNAVDIANDTGTPVLASRAGTAYTYWGDTCGNYVVVDHGSGYETIYCHLDDFTVSDGEWVNRHEQIGLMGSTGHSTGPHVHFEVNYDGDEVFVTGDQGEEVYARSGMPKDYSDV